MAKIVTDVKMPASCTAAEVAAFCCLVKQGDEVDPAALEGRVRQAVALCFLYVERSLAAIAALKRPASSYRDRVFGKANAQNQATDFAFELGWVFVPPEHRRRGYSRVVSSAALSQAEGAATFATTREHNDPMARTLRHLGFALDGRPWKSTRGNHNLVLYVLPPDKPLQATSGAPV